MEIRFRKSVSNAPTDPREDGSTRILVDRMWPPGPRTRLPLRDAAAEGAVTQVYAARDSEHHNTVALAESLER